LTDFVLCFIRIRQKYLCPSATAHVEQNRRKKSQSQINQSITSEFVKHNSAHPQQLKLGKIEKQKQKSITDKSVNRIRIRQTELCSAATGHVEQN